MATILPQVPGPVKRPVKTYFPDGVRAVWVDQRAREAVTLVQFVPDTVVEGFMGCSVLFFAGICKNLRLYLWLLILPCLLTLFIGLIRLSTSSPSS